MSKLMALVFDDTRCRLALGRKEIREAQWEIGRER